MFSHFGKRPQTALTPRFKNSDLGKRKFKYQISIENNKEEASHHWPELTLLET